MLGRVYQFDIPDGKHSLACKCVYIAAGVQMDCSPADGVH